MKKELKARVALSQILKYKSLEEEEEWTIT